MSGIMKKNFFLSKTYEFTNKLVIVLSVKVYAILQQLILVCN